MGGISQEAKERYEKLVAERNFRNKETIIMGYNESVKSYERFRKAVLDNKFNEAAEELSTAASKLAATVEWAEKHIVFHKYYQLLQVCPSSPLKTEWERICNFEMSKTGGSSVSSPKHMSTHDLFRIIRKDFSSEIRNENLSFNCMDNKMMREALINGYKHDGMQPNASVFVQTMDELYRFIVVLVLNKEERKQLRSLTDNYPDSWEKLLLSCGYFKPSRSRRYILLTDCISESEKVKSLFKINWDMVLDLSYADGYASRVDLYEQYIAMPDRKKVVLKYLCDFRTTDSLNITPQTYWIKVNGRTNTQKSNDKILDDRTLASQYVGRHIVDLLNAFVKEYGLNADLVVLGCSKFMLAAIRILQGFGDTYNDSDGLTVHFLNADNVEVKNNILSGIGALQEERCRFYNLTEEEFARELLADVEEHNQVSETRVLIPSISSAKGDIEPDTFEAMKSVMEVLHLGIEASFDMSTKSIRGESFLRGNISADWDIVMDDNFVVVQEKEAEIRNNIIHKLEDGSRSVYRIEYEAGLGGTTFLRRIGFQLHRDYPTVIAHRYIENDLASYLLDIYSRSYKNLVILVDSNDMSSSEVSKLQNELFRNYQFSFVIVYMVRKEHGGVEADRYLRRLNNLQCQKMQDILLPHVEAEICRNNLLSCVERIRQDQMSEEAIPFVLSMYAFDEHFCGIEPYIRHGLDPAEETERDIAFVLALADYANYKVGGQYFKNVYGTNYFNQMRNEGYALASLIKVVDDETGKKEAFKLKYPLFGKQILTYFSENGVISFTKLADRIVEMIQKSKKDEYVEPDEEIMRLMHKLFIEREESEADDSSIRGVYSQLIMQLVEENRRNNTNLYDNSENVVVRIFQTLVDTYPDEPHFAGHLARFYFYTIKNYNKGFEIISEAIENAKSKGKGAMGSLYHIKAMGYSARIQAQYLKVIQDAIEHTKKAEDSEEDYAIICQCIKDIKNDLAFAIELFDEARKESTSRFISNIAECKLSLRIQGYYEMIHDWCVDYKKDDIISQHEQIALYDKVESLIEDCEYMLSGGKGEINNYNTQRLEEIQGDVQLTKAKGEETEKICKQLILSSPQDVVKRARRKLARIQYESIKDNLEHEESQSKLREIVAMMEENFEIDASNNANFRIWFKALRALDAEDSFADLDSIFNKLDRWTMIPNASPDAFYYKYIVRFIQAYEEGTLETSTKVQSDLRELLNDLSNASRDILRKTTPFEWFSDYGKGLRRLITNGELNQMDRNSAIQTLHHFKGALPNRENFAGRRAYISFGQQIVYFNPQSINTNGRITANDENQYVKFGLGFSYDGLRSYHDSISVLKRNASVEKKTVCERGKKVSVKILGSNSAYVKTEIVGSEGAKCDIRINDMDVLGVSKDVWNRKGSIIDVVLSDTSSLANGDVVWRIDVQRSAMKKEDSTGYRPFANIASMLRSNE